jgi:hypothetical protein
MDLPASPKSSVFAVAAFEAADFDGSVAREHDM